MESLGDLLYHTRQGRFGPLVRGQDAEGSAVIKCEIHDGQLAEQIVHEAVGDPNFRIVGHAGWFEPHPHKGFDERVKGNPVLQAVAQRDSERVHDAGERGTLLRHPYEDLTGAAVVILSDGDEAFAVGDAKLECARGTGPRKPFPDWLCNDFLNDLLDDLGGLNGSRFIVGRLGAVAGGQGLSHLAVVSVEGDGLQAQAPRFNQQ